MSKLQSWFLIKSALTKIYLGKTGWSWRRNREEMGQKSQLTAVVLIRMILAVHAPVTPPASVDAFPTSTLKLVDAAGHCCLVLLLSVTVLLVRPVAAVFVSVAAPQSRHTYRVVALERPGAAGGFGAGSLVRAIWAVVVLVANEGGGYTLAVGTSELISFALFGRCGGQEMEKRGVNVMIKLERDRDVELYVLL